MIDFGKIIGFNWDSGNSRKNIDKHDVGQLEAEQVFVNEPLLVVSDALHSVHEIRLHALGHTDTGRLLHLTFTLRYQETMIRIISARDMSRKERGHYAKSSQSRS
ncbi:BrnT family toxin [Pararhizobium sp.]|uniref:BrnT family toxin n=1 Tax=Pararhizobium sp. TaxID=1977563 RepID=UPI002726C555|nr:BrnT family toxin [Pararhizobium sp.]MDO9417230.1 BrnT family toxin [Pararhizobium sp.]